MSGERPRAEDRLHEFANAWRRAIGAANFIPSSGGSFRALLVELARRLVAALEAEPFDAAPAHGVGAHLVAARVSSPQALEATLSFLGQRLLTDLAIVNPDAPQRLIALLAHLAAGFADALHRQDLAAGESINRAERVAWRDKEQRLRDSLDHALLHDPVTGLPNRASLVRWLNGALTDPAAGDRLGICLLDLDDFTALSDSLGPDSADRLLHAVGQRLRAVATNDQYYLAHLGGSQFALVVEYTSSVEDAVKAAEQAMRALSHPYHLAGHELGITARGGVIERHCTQASPVGAHRIPPPGRDPLTQFPRSSLVMDRGGRSSPVPPGWRAHRQKRTEEDVGRKPVTVASACFVAQAVDRRSSSSGGIP